MTWFEPLYKKRHPELVSGSLATDIPFFVTLNSFQGLSPSGKKMLKQVQHDDNGGVQHDGCGENSRRYPEPLYPLGVIPNSFRNLFV